MSDGLRHPNDERVMKSAGIAPGGVAADLWRRHSREIVENILHVAGYHELESIVRDLADRDLVVDIEPEWGTFACFGCPDDHDETYSSRAEVVHAEGCVTQRAREWVDSHPTGDTE